MGLCFMWDLPNNALFRFDVVSIDLSACIIWGVLVGGGGAWGGVWGLWVCLFWDGLVILLGGHVLKWSERVLCS